MQEINIVNVSGGIDSTACYLLALESGREFKAVFADTGNENEITLDYVRELAHRTGGPEVEVVRADFAQKIEVRRMGLERMLAAGEYDKGWAGDSAARALRHLRATGNPFLDVCLYYGYFPATKSRFCTGELKRDVVRREITAREIAAAVARGGCARDVITWLGIRRDESADRMDAEMWDDDSTGARFYRPLVEWRKQDCFALAKRHGLPPNPLYRLGMSRVGCFPCINVSKRDIREIAARFPAHIDRIRQWERLVSLCSRSGHQTFFRPAPSVGKSDIDSVVDWSRTGRGGRQYDLFAAMEPPACSSMYGLCE